MKHPESVDLEALAAAKTVKEIMAAVPHGLAHTQVFDDRVVTVECDCP